MANLKWIIVAVALACGCGGKAERCELYVDMMTKCSGDPSGDRKMAIGLCKAFDGDEEKPIHRKNHECAVSAKDCDAFAVCLDEAQADVAGAAKAGVLEGVDSMLKLTHELTAAVQGKECDAQTQAVRDILAARATQLERLREQFRDRKLQSAVAKSERTKAAVEAFKKAAACNLPTQAFGKAFSNIPHAQDG